MTSRIDLRPAIGKSSAVVALLATFSPVAGLFLEITIAWRYATSSAVDAYRAAYLLINFGNLLATQYNVSNIRNQFRRVRVARNETVAMIYFYHITILGMKA